MKPSEKLKDLGLELPAVAPPVASYVPAASFGSTIRTSGQLPFVNGELVSTGKLGSDLDVAAGQEAARICILNALAAAASQADGIDNISRILHVTGFVASDPNFSAQPAVINGASDLLQEIFGDAGVHTRSAVGVAVLPLNAPVEIEILVEFKS